LAAMFVIQETFQFALFVNLGYRYLIILVDQNVLIYLKRVQTVQFVN